MERVKRIRPEFERSEVTLILADDKTITALNSRIFSRNHATDVISLEYEAIPGDKTGITAEVIVNVQRACEEGMRRRRRSNTWSEDKELALYIAHGCNHLSGEEDSDTASRCRMRRRELRWIRLYGSIQPLVEPHDH